jgi:hypothetical protein
MMESNYYPMYEAGFRTKTLNIRTVAGGTKFLLQQINELGLPYNANVMAMWARPSDAATVSSSNLFQVPLNLQQTAYISLKDRANVYNNINLLMSNYYIPQLTQFAFFMQPVPSYLIDWNQSYIEISGAVAAGNNQVFELVVLYSEKRENIEFPNRFKFRNGNEQAGVRSAYFEIPLNGSQNQYSLGNTNNIGLETDAIILGFRTVKNAYPLTGKTTMDSAAYESSYLTLKKGTDAIIDEFPVALTSYSQVMEEYNYFPIQPTLVSHIDWQQSKIDVKNIAGLTDAMAFQYELIWYSQKC